MSRTKRAKTFKYPRYDAGSDRDSVIPSKFKKVIRKQQRSRDAQALREGRDPERPKRSYRWQFL